MTESTRPAGRPGTWADRPTADDDTQEFRPASRAEAPPPASAAGTRSSGATAAPRSGYAPPAPPVPPPETRGRSAPPGGREAAPTRRGPRRARLAVKRVDPWSVCKFSFVFSLALLVIFVVAVAVLYSVLQAMGVFDSVNSTLADLTTSASDRSNGLQLLFSFRRIVGGAALIGAVNTVLVTALATLGAYLYNACADLVGGIEVTLTERD